MSRQTTETKIHRKIVDALDVHTLNVRLLAYHFRNEPEHVNGRVFSFIAAYIRMNAADYDKGDITNITTYCKRLAEVLDQYHME